MKKSIAIMAAMAITSIATASGELPAPDEKPVIGKSDITIEGGLMTPEASGQWDASAECLFRHAARA